MEYRHLDVTLVSADGLKDVNMFGKMDLYAVAYVLGYAKTKKKTKVDKNCGTSPRWNQKMQFTIDERSLTVPGLTLLVTIKAQKFGGDKDIGEVSVPIPELFESARTGGNDGKDTAERVVEYQVRTLSGRGKGSLKFAFKFGEKFPYDKLPDAKAVGKDGEAVVAYPAGGQGGYGGVGAGPSAPPPLLAYPPPAMQGMGYGMPPPGMGYAQYPHQPPPPPPYQGGAYPGYPGYAPPPPQGEYAYPPPGGYPPPQPHGYGYPPGPPPPAAGYGGGYQNQQPQKKGKKGKKGGGGMGLGLGIGAGLLGGMLIGDMVSDVGEMASYADGYGDAMEDATGGFDF